MSATFGAVSAPTIPSTARAMSTERSVHSEPWLSPSNVTVPIITHHEEDRAGERVEPRQAAERRAQADHAARARSHGEMREKRPK